MDKISKEDFAQVIGNANELAVRLSEDIPKGFKISTDREARAVSVVMQRTATVIKEMEKERKDATGKLRSVISSIDGWFRGPRRKLEEDVRRMKDALADYRDAKDAETVLAVLEHKPQPKDTKLVSGVSERRIVTYEVIDINAVPEEFLLPPIERVDVRKVKQSFELGKPVPGMQANTKYDYTVRTK